MATKHITYSVTVEPTTEPITLNELKDRLRVASCDFDSEIENLLTAGRKQVEYETHRKLVTQTVAIRLDDFPSGDVIEMRLPPVSAVTSVAYVDTAGDSQTYAASNYNTDFTSTPPRIMLVDGSSWPAVKNEPNAVTVTVTAGYGAAVAVPAEAKLAIVEWCRMHWGNCDGDGSKYGNLINSLAWSGYWKGA